MRTEYYEPCLVLQVICDHARSWQLESLRRLSDRLESVSVPRRNQPFEWAKGFALVDIDAVVAATIVQGVPVVGHVRTNHVWIKHCVLANCLFELRL